MAVTEIRTDDLDGSKDAVEVSFSYGGKSYVIDLAPKNQEKLEAALKPYIDKARRAESKSDAPKQRRRSSGPAVGPEKARAIRRWASQNGKKLSTKGRIPAPLVAEYDAAQAAKGQKAS